MISHKTLKEKRWTVVVNEAVSVELMFPGKWRVMASILVPSVGARDRYTRNPDGTWERLDGNFATVRLPMAARIQIDLEVIYSRFMTGLILDE